MLRRRHRSRVKAEALTVSYSRNSSKFHPLSIVSTVNAVQQLRPYLSKRVQINNMLSKFFAPTLFFALVKPTASEYEIPTEIAMPPKMDPIPTLPTITCMIWWIG